MTNIDQVREWKVLGAALDSFNYLESRMEDLILAYVKPRHDKMAFMRDQLLHNSALSFGAKVKVILAIARECGGPKPSRDKFHRALSIRNALAHGDSVRSVRKAGKIAAKAPYGEFLIVRSVKGDGSIEERPRSVAIAELMQLIEELRESLKTLAESIDWNCERG